MRVRPIYLPIAYLLVAMALESNAIAQVSFGRDLTHIKNIALLPPRIDVYELGLGGVREKIDDWSARAVANVTSAIDVELKNLSDITGVVIQPDEKSTLRNWMRSMTSCAPALFATYSD